MEAVETELLETEVPPVARVPMTKAQFLAWEPEDGFLYEFDNGYAEQTTGMKKSERPLIRAIQMAFQQTTAFAENAMLFEETEVWVSEEQMRIPDVAFFTDAQIRASGEAAEPIPTFVVELISPTDRADKVEQKMVEYFAAGVQVLWYVYPALRMVRVFTSVRHSTTFFENESFDAAPALPDLHLTVAELFTP